MIQAETLERLNEYRGFRHVVIHRYAFELYPDRVQALVDTLSDCYSLFAQDIQDFCQFLLELDRTL
ncbi:hypothetical protein BST81_26805 [Leptolyngbya sp. 'hensonii']|nr:hypothetical protein [Leptolyngbya sp. 'hensonii']OLP15359.1 hypothetical protein BST81_26805 [Leptolyngbya sp. 'hensonii']